MFTYLSSNHGQFSLRAQIRKPNRKSTRVLPRFNSQRGWLCRFGRWGLTKADLLFVKKLSHQCLPKHLTCNLNHFPNVFWKLMRIIWFVARENIGRTYLLIPLYRLRFSRVVKRPNNQRGTGKTLTSTLSQDLHMYISHQHAFPILILTPKVLKYLATSHLQGYWLGFGVATQTDYNPVHCHRWTEKSEKKKGNEKNMNRPFFSKVVTTHWFCKTKRSNFPLVLHCLIQYNINIINMFIYIWTHMFIHTLTHVYRHTNTQCLHTH